MYIHYTSKGYSRKLTPEQWRKEFKSIGTNCADKKLKEIKNMIGRGYGILLAHCDGTCSLDNWIDQQLFAVDIDNDGAQKISKANALERAAKIGGSCIVYNSFSNTQKKPKFRMIFQLAEPVTDINLAKEIAARLTSFFPECDQQSKNIVQNYNGTSGRPLLDETAYLDINALIALTPDYVQGKQTVSAGKIKAKNQYKINMTMLTSYCGLARDLEKGNRDMHHDELMLLGSFALFISGGIKWFSKCLDSGKNSYEAGKIKNDIKNYGKNNNHMYNCANHCPYANICQNHGKNIYDKVLKDKDNNLIRKIFDDSDAGLTVPELEEQTEKILEEFLTLQNHVSILKAPTATGKTEMYLRLAKAGDMICLPTHDLAHDVQYRLAQMGKSSVIINERPALDSTDNNTISQLMCIGAYDRAAAIYRAKVKTYENNHHKSVQMQKCIDWTIAMDNINSDSIVICTHARQKYYDTNRSCTVWVDEDPLMSAMINKTYISIQDIAILLTILQQRINTNNKLTAFGAGNNQNEIACIKKAYKYIKHLNTIYVNMTCDDRRDHKLDGHFTADELEIIRGIIVSCRNSFSSHIYSLFSTSALTVVIDIIAGRLSIVRLDNCFVKPGRRYIIMSATISKYIWDSLILPAEKIEYREIKAADYGDIRQYHALKTSRNGIDINLCKYIDTIIDDTSIPMITFKGSQQQDILAQYGFNICHDMHLGKTAGFDRLNGHDIVVVGTYYSNQQLYYETAAALGIAAKGKMCWNKIKMNGFEFPLMAYSSAYSGLRAIQLYIIDTELTQAVGRARTLRTDATVYLFADFPILGAKIMD